MTCDCATSALAFVLLAAGLRYPGRTYQKVPICWACLMGAQT